MTAWRSGHVEVEGGRLAYWRTGGGGPQLLLSHGLTDNGLCWRRLAQALEDQFDIVMLDAAGHGDSYRIVDPENHDPARDVIQAIAALRIRNPVLMGHSVGGRTTAACAAALAGHVEKVVLEDPAFVPIAAPEALAVRRRKFAEQIARFQAETVDEIAAAGRRATPIWAVEEFPDWAEAKRKTDPAAFPVYGTPWQALLPAIEAPTLLVHGEARLGSLITAEIAAEATALNPRIRAVEISGAGHNVRRENFEGYLAAVRAFLRR